MNPQEDILMEFSPNMKLRGNFFQVEFIASSKVYLSIIAGPRDFFMLDRRLREATDDEIELVDD